MRKRFYTMMIVSAAVMLGMWSCEKDDTAGNGSDASTATFAVRLTDAPADYEEVLIDIQEIKIYASFENEEESWINLPFNEGIYNLLDFRNGLDTLIATADLPSGNISQMRLVLGDQNRVKVNGDYHDLDTPSAQQSGLKFNLNTELSAGLYYELWIDFDAARSVVARGNGTYLLKPVIRTFTEASTGAIKGKVLPIEAEPYVMAIAGEDTLSAIPFDDGRFMFKGVESGFYRIEIIPIEGYADTVIENTEVLVGKVTDLGTIELE